MARAVAISTRASFSRSRRISCSREVVHRHGDRDLRRRDHVDRRLVPREDLEERAQESRRHEHAARDDVDRRDPLLAGDRAHAGGPDGRREDRTSVPGRSGRGELRIRTGIPFSIAGASVSGWRTRAPKYASSDASSAEIGRARGPPERSAGPPSSFRRRPSRFRRAPRRGRRRGSRRCSRSRRGRGPSSGRPASRPRNLRRRDLSRRGTRRPRRSPRPGRVDLGVVGRARPKWSSVASASRASTRTAGIPARVRTLATTTAEITLPAPESGRGWRRGPTAGHRDGARHPLELREVCPDLRGDGSARIAKELARDDRRRVPLRAARGSRPAPLPRRPRRAIQRFDEAVGRIAHRGHDDDRPLVARAPDDRRETFERGGVLDRRAAELLDDQSSSPLTTAYSAFRTEAPAAPRTVLCPSAVNFQSRIAQGFRAPTTVAMPPAVSTSRRGCGRCGSAR